MKTAISIPDPIFEAAEELSELLGVSRSELYSQAVQAYVEDKLASQFADPMDLSDVELFSDIDPVLRDKKAHSFDDEDKQF